MTSVGMESTLDWFESHHADDFSDPAVVLAALAFAGAPPEGVEPEVGPVPPTLVPAA